MKQCLLHHYLTKSPKTWFSRIYRSSHPEFFYMKTCTKNVLWKLFGKLAGLQPCTFCEMWYISKYYFYWTFLGDYVWIDSELFVSLKNYLRNENEVKLSKYERSEKTISQKNQKREWITKGNYFYFLAFCSIFKII